MPGTTAVVNHTAAARQTQRRSRSRSTVARVRPAGPVAHHPARVKRGPCHPIGVRLAASSRCTLSGRARNGCRRPMTSTNGSTTSRADRVRARLEAAQSRAEKARTTSSAVEALWSFGSNDRLLGGSLLAGALAYRLFLWVLPLALVMAAGLGFIGAADREAPEELAGDLGLTAYVSSSVADAADQARGGRWALLVIGLVALAISSAAGAKTVRAIHARAWGMPLSAAKGSATAVAGVVGFSVLGVGVTVLGGWARGRP